MATVLATRAASGFPVFKPTGAGILGVAWGTYTHASNLAATTIIQYCRVPKGATVIGGYWYADDLDTGTEELDIDLGWAANGVDAADPDGFGAAETIIQAVVNTDAATGGTGQSTMVVHYAID
jgi:hypothetical protein